MGYHKVHRQEDLSDTEEEEEVYVKEDKQTDRKKTPFRLDNGSELSQLKNQKRYIPCHVHAHTVLYWVGELVRAP